MIAFLAYLLTIPAANWMIGHVGECIPQGPCVLPVGFGLTAPSGVFMIGLALVLRDIVQREWGVWAALVAISAGIVLSALLAPPALVLASAVAFGISECLDLAVYTPLSKRRLVLAVIVSSVVGAIADSALFLWIAFGSLDFIAGQIVGKIEMILLAAAIIGWFQYRRRNLT